MSAEAARLSARRRVNLATRARALAAIKTAKYYDMDRRDVIFTCLTDSAGMYGSRIEELTAVPGGYTGAQAAYDQARYLDGIVTDVSYLGGLTTYRVKLDSGAVVRSSMANTARLDTDTYQATQRVVAWFSPDDCVVLEQ